MKNKIMLLALAVLFAASNLWSDTAGDYRSSAVLGNWSSASSWETYNGSSWIAASVAPTGASGTITIQNAHKIVIDAPLSIGACTLVVNGYLKDSMVITYPSPYTTTVIVNGTYEFAHASASNQGLPTASWNTGSTCIIGSGITSAATGINANQNFYNFELNCPTWSGSLNFGWGGGTSSQPPTPITIGGNVTVKSTGTGRWQWCGPIAGTVGLPNAVSVTVNGNLIIDGNATNASNKVVVTSNGTSNNYTQITININGNTSVTGNPTDRTWTEFSISRGSQGGTGTTVWNLGGNFSMSDATSQNSNSGGGKFNFVKTGTQTLNFSNVYYANSAVNFDVSSGSTLQLNSNLNIVGTFNLNGGIVNSSSSNLLIMGGNYGTTPSFSSGTLIGGSATSYVDGPMGYLNNLISSKTCLFTIGKNGKYRPFTLVVTQDATTQTTYTAELFNSAPTANTLPGSLDKVSSVRYFDVNKGAGANIVTASATLNYYTDDGVTDYNNLRMAKSDGAGNWLGIGGVGTANGTGSITSTINFTALSNFVLANATGGSNPLQAPKVLSLTALIEGFYNNGTNTMVADTVTVELRNSGTFALVDQAKVVLNSSGNTSANFFSAADATNYYLVLKHRNSMETWSNTPQSFTGGALIYDFTTAANKAYGDNMKQIDASPVKFGIYGGNIAPQDALIDLTDEIAVINDVNAFATGYLPTDLTGDDSADLSDIIVVVNNANAFISKQSPEPKSIVPVKVKQEIKNNVNMD